MMGLGDPSKYPGRLLISSPQGHSGKTIVTIGLCYALSKKGLSVQPFKKGPDYIDPSWLSVAAHRDCLNLDPFLIPEDRLLASFERASRGADIAIIEGAMGLYDGLDSVGQGTSSADLGRLLHTPILLVVNTSRMTRSIAAMVTGYQRFEPEVPIAGVILNHVSGNRHAEKLRAAVETYCRIPVVGMIPRDRELHVEERHLGLIPSPETQESASIVERIGSKLESCFDLEQILSIARSTKDSSPLPVIQEDGQENGKGKMEAKGGKVGVFYDRVFNFYYPENLEALIQAGAELVFINSLHDRLPPVDGLYIGGGFPEFFLKELENNRELRKDIAIAIEGGLPVYAECAGLMYLCRSIHRDDRVFEMVGIIPATVHLSQRPQGHGYVIAEVLAENPIFAKGSVIRGHEFHHSSLSFEGKPRFAYEITRGHGIDGKRDGIVYNNMMASYLHLHALGTPEWAESFISLVSRIRKAKERPQELESTVSKAL
jgi:cobyrinic acid a,c-diamide synthase